MFEIPFLQISMAQFEEGPSLLSCFDSKGEFKDALYQIYRKKLDEIEEEVMTQAYLDYGIEMARKYARGEPLFGLPSSVSNGPPRKRQKRAQKGV